jgi:Fe-Mn family superoxide dismutase
VEDFTIIIFWNVMTPNGGGLPTGDLLTAIESAFELLKSLKQNLVRRRTNLVQVGLGFVFTKVEN